MRSIKFACNVLGFFFAALFLIKVGLVFAQESTPTPTPTPTTSQSYSANACSKEKVPACADKKGTECEECISGLINEAKGKSKSLSQEISAANNQIKLSELRIEATKQQIEELGHDIDIAKNKISELQSDINRTTKALVGRVNAVYEVGSVNPWEVFLTAQSINDVFNRLKYLKIVQISDKKKVYSAQQAKTDYNNQKEIFEQKEADAKALAKKLEGYTKQLEEEKASKQQLLQVTRNDESRYQRLLTEARAERAVVLGGGKELFLRNVSTGDSIGSVISGASGCSSGTHLHFSVYQGTSARNPSDYLSSKSFSYSYTDSQYGYYGTISPNGSYPWPIDDPITINQGYGTHGFAQQFYPSGLHDGIDMEGGSLTVKAVKQGKLYQGSYSCSNGLLRYAKVEHDDGLITWYLHIYPN